MARKKIFDGNGCVLKKGATAIGGFTKLGIPGWAKTEIDDTELSNTAWQTALVGKLKKSNDLTGTIKFSNRSELTEENAEYTVEFPGVGTLAIWMQLKSIGDASFESNTGVTHDVAFTVTNLNAEGAETGPVLTLT